MQLFTGTFI